MITLSELEPMPVASATSREHNAEDNQAGTPLALTSVGPNASPARNGTAPVLTFTPPTDPEWQRVPNSTRCPVRSNTAQLLQALKRIHLSENKSKERRMIASEFADKRGLAEQSLKRKYELYVYGGCKKRCAAEACDCPAEMQFEPGDAWCLVDYARAPREENKALRYETIQFYLACCEDNQRCDEAGWREFIRVWQQGRATGRGFRRAGKTPVEYKTLPGYGNFPEPAWHGKFPVGCSASQLRRAANKLRDNYTRDLARVGRQQASTHRLKVFTTRVGLPFAAQYQFDDHEFNVKIRWPDQTKFLRPRGFFVYERLSGSVFAQFTKPTLWDAELGKKEALKLSDFRWAVLAVLMGHGYRHDEIGTQFVWEHGTANDEDLIGRIAAATGGRVTIGKSGRFGKRAHDGQYDPSTPGRGKGNFRRKPGLEGWFSLLDNCHAALAGQTGLSRERCPEQLAGAERETLALVKMAREMAPEQAAKLEAALHTWPEFCARSAEIVNAIETRRDHQLEGWEECGFQKLFWRSEAASEKWFTEEDLALLNDFDRALMQKKFHVEPRLTNPVRLSPREVWTRRAHELTQLHWRHLPDLAGEENAHRNPQENDGTYPVRAGQFEIEDDEIGFGTLRFDAVNLEGRRLFNGARYLCFVNPFLPTHLVACDAKLRVVGICPAAKPLGVLDTKAIGRRQGAVARWEGEEKINLDQRHADEAEHIRATRENNLEVLNSADPVAQRNRRANAEALQPPTADAWARKQAKLAKQAERAAELSNQT